MNINLQLSSSEWYAEMTEEFLKKYKAASKKGKKELTGQIPYFLSKLNYEKIQLNKLISDE
jgi:hypothetical protein